MTVILQGRRARLATVPFLFRASDCLDESGIYALSYGRRVAGVFTRSSPKVVPDGAGRLVRLPNGMPPLAHIGGAAALLLEPQRTNLCTHSEEFDNAAWVKFAVGSGVAPSVLANAGVAPDGSMSADRVTFDAPAAGDQSFIGDNVATVIASLYAESCYVKAWSSADVGKTIVFRGAGGASYGSVVLTAGWQRLERAETAIDVNSQFSLGLRPGFSGSSSGTVAVLLWGGQFELGHASSSYIRTGGTALTRQTDLLYFPYATPPQRMTVYVRGVNRGAYSLSPGNTVKRTLHIGAANVGLDPRLSLYGSDVGYAPMVYDDGVTGQIFSTAVISTPALNDLVEHRGVLRSDGSIVSSARVNSEAEVVGGASAATTVQGAWSAERLYIGGGSGIGALASTHAVVALGERSMDELLELAGV